MSKESLEKLDASRNLENFLENILENSKFFQSIDKKKVIGKKQDAIHVRSPHSAGDVPRQEFPHCDSDIDSDPGIRREALAARTPQQLELLIPGLRTETK